MGDNQAYWLRDEEQRMNQSTETISPVHNAQSNSVQSQSMAQIRPPAPSTIVWTFRIIHFGLCAMMAATAVLSIMRFGDVNQNQVSGFFLSLYLLMFAVLWLTFELMQIYPVDYVSFQLRRNFGFLFQPLGRALFIIFVAFLTFAVDHRHFVNSHHLGLATGILCIADGVLLILLYLKYPNFYPKQPGTDSH